MSYGIEFINNKGNSLFLGQERGLVLVAKGSSTFRGRLDYKGTGFYGEGPVLLFAHFPNGEKYCTGNTTRNSSGQWSIVVYDDWFSNSPIYVNWYIFAPLPSGISPSGYGIAIYNSKSELAYFSDYLPLLPTNVGVLNNQTTGDSVPITNNSSKLARLILPAVYGYSQGSQQSGGFTVTVRVVAKEAYSFQVVNYTYIEGRFASPSVAISGIGTWHRVMYCSIDANFYD